MYEQIGRLKVELDWLKKKKLVCSTEERRQLVELDDSGISFNSDQGSQFTSEKFTGVLAQRGVAISNGWTRALFGQHLH